MTAPLDGLIYSRDDDGAMLLLSLETKNEEEVEGRTDGEQDGLVVLSLLELLSLPLQLSEWCSFLLVVDVEPPLPHPLFVTKGMHTPMWNGTTRRGNVGQNEDMRYSPELPRDRPR